METTIIPRAKAIRLSEQLAHTVKQEEKDILDILIRSQTGDIRIKYFPSVSIGYYIVQSYHFFNDVGMLD